jgi:hypothetical protein
MTQQQQLLWEKLTDIVREKGMDNIHARKLYDEICKLIDMDSKTMISISTTEEGIEVRVGEEAYGNLALVGLLEKIKLSLLDEALPTEVKKSNTTKTKYDA